MTPRKEKAPSQKKINACGQKSCPGLGVKTGAEYCM
jgi:hypothetical protein